MNSDGCGIVLLAGLLFLFFLVIYGIAFSFLWSLIAVGIFHAVPIEFGTAILGGMAVSILFGGNKGSADSK